ncbi:MAG: site-specific DNA-methyltransferase [Selenomonadaceae bacterium]|nr:site-specific DNA-methyltransferase [Selenomonadaceae bacterium]
MTNLDKLEKIFPECITEALDDDGKICRAVNFERLKQILSGERAAGKEAYEFNFVGKKNAELEAHRPTDKTLRPALDESRDFNATENLYVEGDNLEALKILEESYLGKVKMIYIDPPYNTGNDFIYRDDFAQNADDFDAAAGNLDADGNRLNLQLNRESRGRFHSDWCAMIFSRLLLAKNFLSDDGVIFISIDDHEQANLKKICDEVFGEKNFVANIIWKKKTNGNNMGFIPPVHDFIVVYCKDISSLTPFALPLSEEYLNSKYANPDNDPRGAWTMTDLSANHKGPHFAITNPKTGEKFFPPQGRYWVFNEAEVLRRIDDGRIIFGKSGDSRPVQKVFAAERNLSQKPDTWFDKQGYNGDATTELAEIIGRKIFDSPKPKTLIKYILKFATGEDSIVMDFFSGSATTAHAVMELNATDGGHRKFIMIQIGDETPANSEARRAGYEKISDIGKERIRRAGDKLKAEHPALDTGFRVFKVSPSNFKPLPTDLQTLLTFVDNIEPDRNEYDLFFGTLLSKGMTLDKKFAAEEVDGFKVLSADGGEILACFDEKILAATFRKLAERKPRKIFFRDSSFASSADKINALEFIKNFAPDTEVTVL